MTITISKDEYEKLIAYRKQYETIKSVICPFDGLSMTLEYRCDGEKYACRSLFTETEIQGSPYLTENIQAKSRYLWFQIKKAIDEARKHHE